MSAHVDVELGVLPPGRQDLSQSEPLTSQSDVVATRDSSTAALKPGSPSLPYRRQHRDAFARELSDDVGQSSAQLLLNARVVPEAYLDPKDGRLRTLHVQCDARPDLRPRRSRRWQQHSLVPASRSFLLTLTDALYKHPDGTVVLYLPTAILVATCLLFLAKLEPDSERQNFYEPVLYRNWRHPEMIKDTSFEKLPTRYSGEAASGSGTGADLAELGFIARRPMPRYLCFVDDIDLNCIKPRDQVARMVPSTSTQDYIFVSYTRAQFRTGSPNIDDKYAHEERLALLQIGIRAAKHAGVKAFWLDCFPPGDIHADKEDVYRICDIVRAAHSMILAVDTSKFNGSINESFQDWGKRLWTLPELLLSPPQHRICVYNRVDDSIVSYHKRYIGHLSWGQDWEDANQLVDHYEGSVQLSQIELITIANRCLRRRVTSLRKDGDYAYALMGLLRRRPRVVETDTDFMAFARLSLSNSGGSIMERLLCMQPPSRGTPWHSMMDAYGADTCDIEPTCQIADVDDKGDSETIVIEGAYGGNICWSKLERVGS